MRDWHHNRPAKLFPSARVFTSRRTEFVVEFKMVEFRVQKSRTL